MKLGCPRGYPLLDVVIQSRSDDSISLRVANPQTAELNQSKP